MAALYLEYDLYRAATTKVVSEDIFFKYEIQDNSESNKVHVLYNSRTIFKQNYSVKRATKSQNLKFFCIELSDTDLHQPALTFKRNLEISRICTTYKLANFLVARVITGHGYIS